MANAMERGKRAVMPATVSSEGMPDDEVLVIMSTPERARDGHILMAEGCDIRNYLNNPVILWSHDPDEPIARAVEIAVGADGIKARIKFAPPGVSATADRIRGLVKSEIVRAMSVGFDVLDAEPLDAARPRAGSRIAAWELLECSFCSIPVDTQALVTARASEAEDWQCGASTTLAIDDDEEWDGGAAAKAIFDWAGGKTFDAEKARRGFLAYNAAADDKRGSYKLPFAVVVDGELRASKGGIAAASSRLSATDIPDEVKQAATKVLDHYKEKAAMSDTTDRASRPLMKRALTGRGKPLVRGLGGVARFAWVLEELGYIHSSSVWEEEAEQDTSAVPAMLGDGLAQLGKALIAMTTEEVGEMMDGKGIEIDDLDDLPPSDRSFVRAGKTTFARAFRASIARARMQARAGKAVSAANMAKLEKAHGHAGDAAEHLKKTAESHGAVQASLDEAADAHQRAADAHEKLGEALAAAKDAEPGDMAGHLAAAAKHHRAMTRNMDAVSDGHENMALAHGTATDSANAAARCVRACVRAVGSVVDGADPSPGAEDVDSTKLETASGTGNSGGTANVRMFSYARRRQLARELSTAR